MNYIKSATHLIKMNLGSYILFLIVNCLPFFMGSAKYIGDKHTIANFIISIIVSGISLFFIAGIYHHLLKQEQTQLNYFAELLRASKRYFFRIVVITIWIAFLASMSMMLFTLAFKILFGSSEVLNLSLMKLLFGFIKYLIILVFSIYFIYSIPSVYSDNLSETQAISISFKFLRSNITISKPLIIFLVLSLVVNTIAMQFAVEYDYNSYPYWTIMFANNLITKTVNLVVLIAAFLILKDNFSVSKYLERYIP